MDHYLLRIEGDVPESVRDAFPTLEVGPQSVQTVLYGELPDQAALAGVLDLLDQLGVVIVEVLNVPSSSGGVNESDPT